LSLTRKKQQWFTLQLIFGGLTCAAVPKQKHERQECVRAQKRKTAEPHLQTVNTQTTTKTRNMKEARCHPVMSGITLELQQVCLAQPQTLRRCPCRNCRVHTVTHTDSNRNTLQAFCVPANTREGRRARGRGEESSGRRASARGRKEKNQTKY
jgi:hypothetical protein